MLFLNSWSWDIGEKSLLPVVQFREWNLYKKIDERPVFTYIIRDANRVKIGISRYPQKRLSCLQSHCPDKLSMIAIFEGNRERELHAQFVQHHLRGEWFLSEPVLTWLKKLRPNKPVSNSPETSCVFCHRDCYTKNRLLRHLASKHKSIPVTYEFPSVQTESSIANEDDKQST